LEFAGEFPAMTPSSNDPRLVQCPRCFALYEVLSGPGKAVFISPEEAEARHPGVGRLHAQDPGSAVPDLRGLDVSEVLAIGDRLVVTVYDAATASPLTAEPAVVVEQWPGAGHRVWAGDGITVRTNRRPLGEWDDETGVREPRHPQAPRDAMSEVRDAHE
jgi:hypothetical protein